MSSSRIRGILFDLDGVLASTADCHCLAWQKVLQRYGIHLEAAWFRDWIGVGDPALAEHLRRHIRPDLPVQEMLEAKLAMQIRILDGCLRPFPGVREGVLALQELPRAVATSSARVEVDRVFTLLQLHDLFPLAVTADEVERLKPAPDLYLAAAARLGLPAGDCAAIEDSPTGVEAAGRAGCRLVLAVTHTHSSQRLRAAHRHFGSTADALRWIRETAAPG